MAAPQRNITDKRKTRQNLFGFGRKPAPAPVKRRRGGLTLSEAASAAVKAGRKSGDLSRFDDWLEAKHLETRSDGFVSRVRDDYKRGVLKAEADEANKEFLKQKREQARELARDRKEQARAAGRKPKAAAASPYSSMPDEAALQAGFKRGLSLSDMLRANPSLRKLKAANPSKFMKWVKTLKNPAQASAEAFEEFHGYGPTEVVTVQKKVHHHKHLASAGVLVGLGVKPISGGPVRQITGLGDDCFLAFNEAKNQLFVEGGDQRMTPSELKKFGIRDEHEIQTLGKLVSVGYFTNKTHLGKEGGEAVYSHTFRATNNNGKHVIVKIARHPDLIYRVLDEQFELSGGSYEILREGINK